MTNPIIPTTDMTMEQLAQELTGDFEQQLSALNMSKEDKGTGTYWALLVLEIVPTPSRRAGIYGMAAMLRAQLVALGDNTVVKSVVKVLGTPLTPRQIEAAREAERRRSIASQNAEGQYIREWLRRQTNLPRA